MQEIMEQIKGLNLPIVLYGAGEKGVFILSLLKKIKIENIYCFCDSDSSKWGEEKCGLKILSLLQIKNKFSKICFLIAIKDKEQQIFVKNFLEDEGFSDHIFLHDQIFRQDTVEANRMICAVAHEESFEDYFKSAENSLQTFWGEASPFLRMFQELDKENIVELAVGRGRHVSQYLHLASHITIVDILEKNIEFCKNRFKDVPNITYYKNSGYDLAELKDNCYTALFTYDAMVHFELIDIYQYLRETHRILCHEGKAVFHHSNLHSDYKISFSNSPYGGRNFMSKEIFAHLAYRCGFEILEQQVIDWGKEELDCITLVQKQ